MIFMETDLVSDFNLWPILFFKMKQIWVSNNSHFSKNYQAECKNTTFKMESMSFKDSFICGFVDKYAWKKNKDS